MHIERGITMNAVPPKTTQPHADPKEIQEAVHNPVVCAALTGRQVGVPEPNAQELAPPSTAHGAPNC